MSRLSTAMPTTAKDNSVGVAVSAAEASPPDQTDVRYNHYPLPELR